MSGEDLEIKARAIGNAEVTDQGIAFAVNNAGGANSQIINAQIADELLMIKGVIASFVLGFNDKGKTLVSARSLGDVNVQSLMEKLGGGGHQNVAAAQVTVGPEEAIALVVSIMRDEGTL